MKGHFCASWKLLYIEALECHEFAGGEGEFYLVGKLTEKE